MTFFPARVEVKKEVACWHIERDETPSHMWSHHHEYNFAAQISITPRIHAIVTAFYLSLSINNEVKRADYPLSDGFPEIIPKEKLANVPNPKIFKTYVFQLNVPNEISIPPYGFVILEFNRGKTKNKVSISLNDDYRPEPCFMQKGG